MLSRLLTKAQAAEILGVRIRTIERMIAGAEIPSVKIRRCRRIPESAVRALMAAGERGGRLVCPSCGNEVTLPGVVASNVPVRCERCGWTGPLSHWRRVAEPAGR